MSVEKVDEVFDEPGVGPVPPAPEPVTVTPPPPIVTKPVKPKLGAVIKPPETEALRAKPPIEYNLCSWCGGWKRTLLPPRPIKDDPDFAAKFKAWEKTVEKLVDKIVIGQNIPTAEATKPPLMACIKCLSRVFSSVLGQSRFHGVEVKSLMGNPRKGYFPERG